MKSPTVWILVANGTQAKIIEYQGPNHNLHIVDGAVFNHEVKPDREIYSSKPGRSYESANAGRHAIEYHSDQQRLGKEKFAHEVANFLEKHAQINDFDRLIMVAAPQMMGDFRHVIGINTKKRVQDEINKDLVNVDINKLPEYLGEVLWI